ncbi:MAG: ATP-dependent DNA helicase RecG, partial [Planctomycetota bacterium]
MSDVLTDVTLATPTKALVGLSKGKLLGRIGIRTVGDLCFCFPRDYELPAPPTPVDQLKDGEAASLVGTITDAELTSRTPGKSVFGAIVQNETGAVRILFFNQPFRAEQITLDRKVMISGEAKLKGLRFEFVHPKVTFLDGEGTIDKPRILPVYPLTEGVRQNEMRTWVGQAVDAL